MNYINIISLIAIFGFGLYIFYKLHKIKVRKQIEEDQELERLARIQALEAQERLRLEYEHWNKLYQLNTHRVKLRLFDARRELLQLIYLYELVIVKNYWISEPFYSKFYELLILFEKNNLMIVDPNAKVITMNLRDHNNEVHTSRAFEVYSSADIVDSVLRLCMKNILQFKQQDAQNIIIAICIFVLEKSVHYRSQKVFQHMVIDVLSDYKNAQDVRKNLEWIKEKKISVKFVFDAFEQALNTAKTYPYNDSEAPKQLQLVRKLPQKFLQEF
ncbi:MAG: hypothetical protein IE909_08620 [Campylobacterales bacterium]|nr:hypothetical protein [Campylobacterales bacterium]